MSKIKPLSRNKTIKILHELTGKTYKECREALKVNNWSLGDALGINTLIATLQAVPETIERLRNYIIATAEAANAAFNAFKDTFNEALSND
jgi:hypothetical protein